MAAVTCPPSSAIAWSTSGRTIGPRLFVAEKDEARDHARIVGEQLTGRDRIDDALKLRTAAKHDLLRSARFYAGLIVRHAHAATVAGEIEPIDIASDAHLGTGNRNKGIGAPG